MAHTSLRIEAAMAAETEAVVGKTTINYKAASRAVEKVVVAVAEDTAASAAMPEAGISGKGNGSDSGDGRNVGVDGGEYRGSGGSWMK